MTRHVNAIAGRLSLRPPQRQSLEILDRVTEIAPPRKDSDVAAALAAIRSEYPSVTDFEREFPSICFALATGVGKTRLMGAFISYLHLAHRIGNFFVLAPNLTIYNKLITDFTPNTPKYVFRGIAEFATEPPEIITGDTWEAKAGSLYRDLARCKINVFNISKINSEVRGGKAPRIKRLSEYIGQSYFDYLAALPDLVLLMDESHRYRATAGVKAINDLKPILGLELTATPVVEKTGGAVRFANVIYDYPLGRAMADGFVKEPAVVTRKNFDPSGMTDEQVETVKLEDGIRLHEQVKVELETYARENEREIVKPFVLVVAQDTSHAARLKAQIESDQFFGGRYRDKVIQVDSSRTGEAEEKMIADLLQVERADNPTEIVIHVNMLKEGWDVTNLYTIVPLRAANARVLIEQTIGRGLRLPYGKRTGVTAVDRLNIVAHDRFQEIVDEANRADSPIRLTAVSLDADELARQTVTVVSQPIVLAALGTGTTQQADAGPAGETVSPLFAEPAKQAAAVAVYGAIQRLAHRPDMVPTLDHLRSEAVQTEIVRQVSEQLTPAQLELGGIVSAPDLVEIVAETTAWVTDRTIGIPRIVVVPRGDVRSGFRPFEVDVSGMRYTEVSEELWVQHLRTNQVEVLSLGPGTSAEERPEDYIVAALVDYDDISYDHHAELLYELAGQAVRHFHGYLSPDEADKVLRYHQKEIGRAIHAQMQAHYWEEATGYEVNVSSGYVQLRESAFTKARTDGVLDYRVSPADKSLIPRSIFGGFARCLFRTQKFHSDTERRFAVILERDSQKWFRPAKDQFRIYYGRGHQAPEYQPDFAAETDDAKYIIETKARGDMDNPEVVAKRDAAVLWCRRASEHEKVHGGKPWTYVLIPDDAIQENRGLGDLVQRYRCD